MWPRLLEVLLILHVLYVVGSFYRDSNACFRSLARRARGGSNERVDPIHEGQIESEVTSFVRLGQSGFSAPWLDFPWVRAIVARILLFCRQC